MGQGKYKTTLWCYGIAFEDNMAYCPLRITNLHIPPADRLCWKGKLVKSPSRSHCVQYLDYEPTAWHVASTSRACDAEICLRWLMQTWLRAYKYWIPKFPCAMLLLLIQLPHLYIDLTQLPTIISEVVPRHGYRKRDLRQTTACGEAQDSKHETRACHHEQGEAESS